MNFLQNMSLATFLGDYFSKSSGHPAEKPQMFLKTTKFFKKIAQY
jgi:hypothetical protein